ncbi:MAG TPA: VCBS repeat-containing protein [Roseiflexaceae bacterium]|nr:VCBS repeat-containing protein [Roseiflexaceae bacterium]
MATQRSANMFTRMAALIFVVSFLPLMPPLPAHTKSTPSSSSANTSSFSDHLAAQSETQSQADIDFSTSDINTEIKHPVTTASGDFNGDGIIDIAIAGYNVHNNIPTGALNIFFGHGDGTFERPLSVERIGSAVISLVMGDINNDKVIDLLVVNESRNASIDMISWNKNSSSFLTTPILNEEGSIFKWIALGDINKDNSLDIVFSKEYHHSQTASIQLLLNNGGNSFHYIRDIISGKWDTTSIVLGDLNNDEWIDLIIGNIGAPSVVSLGEGNNKFGKPTEIQQKNDYKDVHSVALGDFNSDGALDVVFGNGDQPSQIALGKGDGSFESLNNVSEDSRPTKSIAVGDLNGDGLLDLVQGNYTQPSRIYLGRGDGSFDHPANLSKEIFTTRSIDLADFNGDSRLDVVMFNDLEVSKIFLSHNENLYTIVGEPIGKPTTSTAVADINRDGIDDVVFGYENKGIEVFTRKGDNKLSRMEIINPMMPDARSIAIGDFNKDGLFDITSSTSSKVEIALGNASSFFDSPKDLNIITKNESKLEAIDLNSDNNLDLVLFGDDLGIRVAAGKGDGSFNASTTITETITDQKPVDDIAIGNIDNDKHQDIIFCKGYKIYILKGDENGNFSTVKIIPFYQKNSSARNLNNVDLGDFDGDEDLDIAIGPNYYSISIAFNKGNNDFEAISLLGESYSTSDIHAADMNGDGALDLLVGSKDQPSTLMINKGNGAFTKSAHIPGLLGAIRDVATGDLNGDGVLDAVFAGGTNYIVFGQHNQRIKSGQVGLNLPTPAASGLPAAAVPTTAPQSRTQVQVFRPGPTPDAPLLSTPAILSGPVITVPFRLMNTTNTPVKHVLGFYSLDGGGVWQRATPASTQTTNLAASSAGTNHVFAWDIVKDNISGKYDQVVFRIVAVPDVRAKAGSVAEQMRFAAPSATSVPFRIRGIQARVIDTNGQGVPGAHVYRLDNSQVRNGQLIPVPKNGNAQWYTDWGGLLKGHEPLTITDRLVALAPISATQTYTLYHTSAQPISGGLKLQPVLDHGVQTLTVSPNNPLILFNLDLSVEWDARNDASFRAELEVQLKRASELLFRWSGGQIALGDIHVFNNGERWNDAHIRLYATNRLRPSAAQGGIVETERADPDKADIVYERGQVRMGAVWNRYGEASADLGEEWARTLAHELGHYALFLNDNYLVKKNGRLISDTTCPGPMTDPYDDRQGSFHPQTAWLEHCGDTLSQLENGRADWTTIKDFYTTDNFVMNEPPAFNAVANPKLLPLAVTQMQFDAAFGSGGEQSVSPPVVQLKDETGAALPLGGRARGMLFQNISQQQRRLIDLGSPVGNQLVARGAHRDDMVCVYTMDPAHDQQRRGCVQITSNNQDLTLSLMAGWRPEVKLRPINATQLTLEISGVALGAGENLYAELHLSNRRALPQISLVPISSTGSYSGTLADAEGMFEGLLRIWSGPPAAPHRETVIDLRMEGYPGGMWRRGAPRGSPGGMWRRGAPVLSADGQAILHIDQRALLTNTLYLLQASDSPPAPPVWATPVSRAYRLTVTNDASFANSSLNIGYLRQDVSEERESGIHLFAWNETERRWDMLDSVRNTERKEASAVVSTGGLYMLMTTTRVPLTAHGWNLVRSYSGETQTITQATTTLQGRFSLIAGLHPRSGWQIYDPTLPPVWAALVNDLTKLQHNQAYWIHATEPVSWFVRAPGARMLQQSIESSLPPAVLYGRAPAAGVQVEALVEGKSCGTATSVMHTLREGPSPVFVLRVRAQGDGDLGCGREDIPVTLVFRTGAEEFARFEVGWDNTRAQEVVIPAAVLALRGPGWNQVDRYAGKTLPLPLAATQIISHVSSIYGTDMTSGTTQWRLYDPALPADWAALVNDLTELRYGQSYSVHATEPVSWALRSGAPSPAIQPMAPASAPPATFYGRAPAAGMQVEALVEGKSCGTATSVMHTLREGPSPVFVLRARAQVNDKASCGSTGRTVTLVLSAQKQEILRMSATWDNTRAQLVAAHTLYVPLIRR